jgi:hypothetical protein
MTTQEYFVKYSGKFIDFDHAFGNTCVDNYRQYCQEVLQFSQSPSVNGAGDIWNNYLQDKFIKIPNTPLGIPQLGDIVVWNKQLNGYGHVAIFQSGNIWNLTCFSQNWPIGSPCHLQKTGYKYVLGWLRPKMVIPVPIILHIPLQVAFIGLQTALHGDFQVQLALYSQNKITMKITDYNVSFTIPTSGMFTQSDAYALIDKLDIKEKFIFIFYPPNSTSAFYASYYYPKRNCCITTAPGTDARLLTFEFAHQLQYFYNENRGSGSPVQVIDSNFPTDELIKSKYDSVSQYYQ